MSRLMGLLAVVDEGSQLEVRVVSFRVSVRPCEQPFQFVSKPREALETLALTRVRISARASTDQEAAESRNGASRHSPVPDLHGGDLSSSACCRRTQCHGECHR
jgi:hypothetical protein